jgi:D-lyxose ketol-isomerase
LKRSEINLFILDAIDFFEKHHFSLPPFAHWTLEEWRQREHETDEIRERRLGWDVTDFNSGTFSDFGLTLFTLRNGGFSAVNHPTSYAEKIMMVRERQITPLHRHDRKTEDIINRGNSTSGNLVVQLYNSTKDGRLANTPVTVTCDGIMRHTEAGGTIILRAGESITLPPGLYHSFYSENGNALIGEVSSTNDDATDNLFYQPQSRFPEILEDELPFRLLCMEYPKGYTLVNPTNAINNI